MVVVCRPCGVWVPSYGRGIARRLLHRVGLVWTVGRVSYWVVRAKNFGGGSGHIGICVYTGRHSESRCYAWSAVRGSGHGMFIRGGSGDETQGVAL